MKEKGVSALEVAIILLAFVVVATVFTFTILSVQQEQGLLPRPKPTIVQKK
jgi:flagellin-like protein